jgi:hypothetical protein
VEGVGGPLEEIPEFFEIDFQDSHRLEESGEDRLRDLRKFFVLEDSNKVPAINDP